MERTHHLPLKLHIGGKEVRDGWKIMNIQQLPGVDFLGDITNLSQFPDNSVACIYASHVLEHVPQRVMKSTLKELYRVLEPNGQLMLSVPDLEVLSHAILNPNLNDQQKFHVMRMMFGGQIDEHDFHYFGWTPSFMKSFLTEAGFSTVSKVKGFGIFNDTSNFQPYGFPISLNVLAEK